jgi:hypothetical protein
VIKRAVYLFITLLAVNALLWLLTAFKFIAYPYSLDFGEGILLAFSDMLVHGQNIYPPITDYPYIVCNYHPLFPFLAGLPFIFSNPGLWTGRLISLLAAIGCMILTGKITTKVSGKSELGWLSALLPLCLSYPYNWAFVYRVDYLGVFLSLLGLYLYMFPRRKGGIWWAILPFTLAFLTKISFILAPLACLIDIFRRKDRESLRFTIVLIFACVIPYLIINFVTNFGMYRDTIIYTANAFHLDRVLDGYREILEYTLPLWLAMIIGAAFGKGKFRFLILTYIILLFISLVTYGAEGSDSNYFLELIFALSIGAIIWLPSPEENGSEKINLFFNYRWLIGILIIFFFIQGRIFDSDQFGHGRNLKKMSVSQEIIDKYVSNEQGKIISEDVTFLAKNRKPMIFQPYIMSLLARKGKWDQTRFVDDLRNARFSLIILRFDVNDPNNTDKPGEYGNAGFDRFTDEMENAIKDAYGKPFCPNPESNSRWFLYLPKVVTK